MLFSYQIAIDIENESKQQNKYLDGMVSQYFTQFTFRLWHKAGWFHFETLIGLVYIHPIFFSLSDAQGDHASDIFV